MEYRLATVQELEAIYTVVQFTIKKIYPKYYPEEVVDFFCGHHNLKAITEDVENNNVSVLLVAGKIIGTGSFVGNHVTRVYVLPKYQGRGYGTYIMKQIEGEIAKEYDKAVLDASLPAVRLYEKSGYKTVKHEKYPVENDAVLVYEVMEKKLN